MGIGTLDSEESSSSAASSIALVLSASADENSNGTTPNLDAPKMCHNRIISYRPMDNTLDSTLNSDMSNNTLIGSPNIDHHDAANCNTSQQSNNIKTIVCDYQNVESKESLSQQQVQFKHGDNVLTQNNRKVAILGIGAGIASSGSLSVTTAPQVHNANSNSNSPSAGRSIRSPLATVTGNNNNRSTRNASQNSQQIINTGTNATATTINNNAHVNNGNVVGGTTNTGYMLYAPNYMPIPSTSKQSTLIQQQQRQQMQLQMQSLRQHQQQSQQTSEPHIDLYDNFFLFRQHQLSDNVSDGMDHFSNLSDEIILQIFKWLPKKALIRCSHVSRRLNRCAKDESLWTRLDLGGRHLRAGALENILTRGVVILRLAQAELTNPVFKTTDFLQAEPKFESKLQYLDLSMVSVTKPSLKMLLSRCRQLKKLSLEHVPINDEICNEIAANTNLEALNLAMCIGLEAWSVRKIMESLKNLNSLNISWTNLSVDAVTSVVTNVTPNLMRLNMAGCRKTLYDSHVASLAKRCTQLLEIDFSDCTALTGNVINIICRFKMLEYLSLSRCYLIPASAYMDLSNLSTLTYLDIFGMLSDTAMELLEQNFPNIGINKFIHSSVARPTVGTRRTSIWGLRTRD
ncbi:S-phase kinase-associated protein 2 isoform X2 [Eurosta solidaginis]